MDAITQWLSEETIVLLASLASLAAIGAFVWGIFVYFRPPTTKDAPAAELAKKQLEILVREEHEKNRARVALDLIREGNNFRFRIKNISEVDARDVEIELLTNSPNDNPIIASEYEQKFPVKHLAPGSSVSLIAAIHIGSPVAYNAIVKWTNPDGKRVEEETSAAL